MKRGEKRLARAIYKYPSSPIGLFLGGCIMRAFVLGLILIAMFVPFVSAEGDATPLVSSVVNNAYKNSCLSTEQLQSQIEKCQSYGLDYQTYLYDAKDVDGKITRCKNVECAQKQVCPTEENLSLTAKKCSDSGLKTTYYVDGSQCQQVYCSSKTQSCPSKEDNLNYIKSCESQGLSYNYSTGTDGCPSVSCQKNVCSTDKTSLGEAEKKCNEMKGKPYQYQDAYGCTQLGCNFPNECYTSSVLQEKADSCVKSGYSYETYVKENGCKEVYCKGKENKESVSCQKKVGEDGCVKVSCTDGYYFDSCIQTKVCQSYECKTYEDAQGCTVKSCTDGGESITCPPKKEVECKVTTNKSGCEVKECTDGTRYEYCPTLMPECKTTKDKSGCIYKVCIDPKTGEKTYSSSYCPEKESSKPVQCKVYTTEGKNVKVCDNGFKVVYADLTNCVATNADGAAKKCAVKNTPFIEYLVYVDAGGNEIECLVNLADKTTLCTANMEKEKGAANVTTKAPASGNNPAESEKPTESFWAFLSKLFGGK